MRRIALSAKFLRLPTRGKIGAAALSRAALSIFRDERMSLVSR
jgi:hypothetical protein